MKFVIILASSKTKTSNYYIPLLIIMFTTGRIIFTVVFLLIFIIGLAWSYRKDRAITKIHFNKPYLILIAILSFLTILYIIVKIRKFL